MSTASNWIYENSTLGFKVPVKIPWHNGQEYDLAKGEPNAHMNSLAALECYSNFNREFGEKFAEALSAETGVAIPGTGKFKPASKDGKPGEEILVTPKEYLTLLLANKTITEVRCQQIATDVANAMPPIDISSSRGPAKPSKPSMTAAAQVMASLAQAGRSVEEWVESAFAKYPNGPVPSDEGFTQEYVARVIDHINRCRAAELAAL